MQTLGHCRMLPRLGLGRPFCGHGSQGGTWNPKLLRIGILKVGKVSTQFSMGKTVDRIWMNMALLITSRGNPLHPKLLTNTVKDIIYMFHGRRLDERK